MTDDSLNQLPAPYREIFNILREPLELSRTLKLVMDAAMRLTGAERGVFMLMIDNSKYTLPSLRTAPFTNPNYVFGNGAFVAYSLAYKSLQEGHSIVIEDSSNNAILEDESFLKQFFPLSTQETILQQNTQPWFRLMSLELEQDYPVSILVMPLQLPKNQIGAIYLSRGKYLGAFNTTQITDAEIFTELAASQIHTAILLKNAQEHGNSYAQIMAHELKMPLVSIKGFSQLLLTNDSQVTLQLGTLTDKQRSFIEIILRNTERAKSLIDNLSFLTKIEIGILHLDIRDVDIYEVINNQIKFYQPIFESKQQKFSVVLAGDSLHVLADRWRLEQVIRAMLRNAYNFTPEGGEIKITASIEGDFCRFAISDTGIGLTPDEKSRLFQKFSRTTRANEKHYGYGLDLYLAKHIIEHFGGQISADGEVDQGSTFWFTVPISPNEGEN